jgi:uncharacterized membrane protein
MDKNRLEAFSDGVIAIIITVMVLEMKAPYGPDLRSLEGVTDVFLSYVLSFVYLAIYWNNHHHLFKAVKEVGGAILWANMHLLFWLSLIPFTSDWMGKNAFATWPVVLYGVVLLCAAIAYRILVTTLMARHGRESLIAKAIGNDSKGKISIVMYTLGIGLSFIHPMMSCLVYTGVAVMWIVPDQRIEKRMLRKE